MTRKDADKLENTINEFVLALLDEINYPNQHPYNGDHTEFDKVCRKTSRKRNQITKLINKLVKEV